MSSLIVIRAALLFMSMINIDSRAGPQQDGSKGMTLTRQADTGSPSPTLTAQAPPALIGQAPASTPQADAPTSTAQASALAPHALAETSTAHATASAAQATAV